MTGMVGNKWSFDNFSPMEVIPTAVNLTTYAGESEDFMSMPLQELVGVDDNVREQAEQILDYVKEARDYDARVRQQQEESAARAATMAAASRADQVAAQSDQVAARSDEASAEKTSDPAGPPADTDAPVLKRRVPPRSNRRRNSGALRR